MNIKVKSIDDLTDSEIREWRAVQQADLTLSSPFYSPDFSRAVNAANKQVLVAIITNEGRIVGLLPFHLGKNNIGVPVGGPISDFQGIIGPVKETADISKILKACGLKAYDFNHLPASQSAFAGGAFRQTSSPYLDLSGGFDAYFAARSAAGTKELKNTQRKRRKIEREIGQLRFELNDKSSRAWQSMIAWKNRSYERLGVNSVFDIAWASETLKNIRDTENDFFSGMFSTIYVGDRLVAAHFGMRSHETLHWWFPTYDPDMEKYSPGLILLLELARQAPDIGMTRIDLGRGVERYKKSFASDATTLCEGSIELPLSLSGSLRFLRKQTHRCLSKSSRLDKVTNLHLRVMNRLLGSVSLPEK